MVSSFVDTTAPVTTTTSWVNNTIPIPPYLGLDGPEQAGLIAGYFVATVLLTIVFGLALFNPCGCSCKRQPRKDNNDVDLRSCYDKFCCCCPPKDQNWVYLCCSVIFLKFYFACCCNRCCRKSRRWATKRANTVKEALQNEAEVGWEMVITGHDNDDDDNDNDNNQENKEEEKKHFDIE